MECRFFLTSKGNENWPEKSASWRNYKETSFGSSYWEVTKLSVREIGIAQTVYTCVKLKAPSNNLLYMLDSEKSR